MPRSPLHDRHTQLQARFVDFAGWEMPVQYEGVISEHMAVRKACGVFDVSHLGRFSVEGDGSVALLRSMLCNDADAIGPGRAQYTMALNEAGGVIDDIIIWRWAESDYWVLPNGANFDDVVGDFQAAAAEGVTIAEVRSGTVLLAVQGPRAPEVMEKALGTVPGRFRLAETQFGGETIRLAGTGYTGERGAEVAAPLSVAGALLDALLSAGAIACGLGARETLRLEMGYPLWGQDLDERTTPLEAGLGWVVDWEHEYRGRSALDAQRADGVPKALIGFAVEGRQIPRHDYPMRSGDSTGVVTSGNYSPVLEHGIGMGYLSPPANDAQEVEIEIRGRWVEARITDTPFIKKG